MEEFSEIFHKLSGQMRREGLVADNDHNFYEATTTTTSTTTRTSTTTTRTSTTTTRTSTTTDSGQSTTTGYKTTLLPQVRYFDLCFLVGRKDS